MPRRLHAVGLALALVAGVASAAAQESVDPETKKHFDVANALYGEQRYADALGEYDAAYDRSHNFRILYNRGNCLVMLKREPEAIETFERYLKDGGDQIPEERRTKVRADIASLKMRLGTITLDGAPDGAEVVLDGRVLGRAPLSAPIPASAGTHDLAVRWSAAVPGWSGEVHVVAGAPVAAKITLGPPPGTPPTSVSPPVGTTETNGGTPAPKNPDEGARPARLARGRTGLVAPALTVSLQLGGSQPANDANVGRTRTLGAAEIGLGWRISPFLELGAFYGGATGGYDLSAPPSGVDPNADFGYRTYGVRARMHLVRGAWYDGWFGVDFGRYTESWTLKGASGFEYDAASTLFALAFGADFPLGRAFAVGAGARYVAGSAGGATASGCASASACPGDVFSGPYASSRGYLEFGARLVFSIPLGDENAPIPQERGSNVAALPNGSAF